MEKIKGVFFDLGGTLRIAEHVPEHEARAAARMAELAGAEDVAAFMDMVESRYEPYREWALTENKESGDYELWAKWLLPEYPEEKLREICHEMTYQYRQVKGLRHLVDGGLEVIQTLHARGYKLGIISNLIGETEIYDWLREDNLEQYFDAVILSSVCHIRKPDPQMYFLGCEALGLRPEECASVADNLNRDITGAKAAHIGANILYISPEKLAKKTITDENRPDYIVHRFTDILELPFFFFFGKDMKNRIDTIFFDLGDTFRVIRKDREYQRQAKAVITRCLGVDTDPEDFYRDVIEPRYDEYRKWALTYYCEAPVEVLWTRWLAYDFPRDRVIAHAAEMTWAYRKTKGERVVTEGGIDTVKELYRRGYTLAIVSDLVGVEEVDDWLDHDGLRPYFKSVQQSSVCLIRKPHPAIYYYALAETGADPKRTCFVGDNLNRDIIGAKAAGLGMTVGVQYPDKKPQTVTEENKPDVFIHHFTELLDLFPPLGDKD